MRSPLAPGSDDLKVGSEGGGGEFEAHLIVTLAGSAVRQSVGPFGACNFNESLGDERAGHGSAEQIAAFIERAGTQHGEDEVAGEFLAQIFHIGLAGAGLQRLFIHAVQIVFLPEVGGHGDNFATVGFNEPPEDDGRIQSSGIGEDYLFDLFGHETLSERETKRLRYKNVGNRGGPLIARFSARLTI